ncbi:hypothetical protein [Streptomyces lavendulae]|uniref:hypothetical protein n=1 Tax=Streptomyces lavendulae TaxID=1914 RepID=UPI0024A063ED|nr:hypothetical protein [Streptomyces lavendulae]GLX22608.1 hypothetical protein Slala01_62520 [Streptomyces lavendulae subsp. lavendulae]GLX30091.1 hypothetical protein Slala02_59110 [Streptomyces lavendulae subsp. lavendulae]
MSAHEVGHEWIYRVTALADRLESKYVLSPYEARSLKEGLRQVGYEADVARVPASAFVPLSNEELDALVDTAAQTPAAPA